MADAFVLGGVRPPVGRYGGSLSIAHAIRSDELSVGTAKPVPSGPMDPRDAD